MRMPLAAHSASISLDFDSITAFLRRSAYHGRGAGIHRATQFPHKMPSCQIAPEHQRRRPLAVGSSVVPLAAAGLAEARAPVEPTGGRVGFIHFEEDDARADPGEATHM